MAPQYQIQVLHRTRHFNQGLVTIPAPDFPPLARSSLRLQPLFFGVSLNTFTNAKYSALLHSFDAFPLPPSTPEPYNDASTYGRINVWGYMRVLESTHPLIPIGSYVFGYMPIGSLPFDLEVEVSAPSSPSNNSEGEKVDIEITSTYRKHLAGFYNRHVVYTSPRQNKLLETQIVNRDPAIAFDVLNRLMHETAFLLATRVFRPSPSPPAGVAATVDLTDSTVLCFGAGAKVATAFAWMMMRSKEVEGKGSPKAMVGVSSLQSKTFVEGTGLYDVVVSSDKEPQDEISRLAREGESRMKESKVVVMEFGGRGGAAVRWTGALMRLGYDVKFFLVGGEVEETEPAQLQSGMEMLTQMGGTLIDFGGMQEGAMQDIGKKEYRGVLADSWKEYSEERERKFKVRWGSGMDSVVKTWQDLCDGQVKPDEGLVFNV